MGVRSVLRVVMVLLGVTVGLLVYFQWRTDAEPGGPGDPLPRPELPEGERDVEAVTHSLRYSRTEGGREVLSVTADRQVNYTDGWNVWEGPEVVIGGRDPARTDDDVRVVGDTMRTTSDDDGNFIEVRLIGNVVAHLAGGGVFESRRIDYDAVTGVASNCNRNTLEYAGLLVGSDCLHFQTAGDVRGGQELAAEELRMWQRLTIEAAEDGASSLPAGLRGGASELRFRPGGELVTLYGNPEIAFDAATLRGRELQLDVGPAARELRHVRAVGAARARISEAGEHRRGEEGVLEGEEVVIDFGEGAGVDRMRASAGAGTESRLRLPGQGSLSAGTIELSPSEGRQEIRATDGVRWKGDGGGVRQLRADELELDVGDGGLERLEARGEVETLPEDTGSDGRRFAGPRLSMRWEGQAAPTFAAWPEGVEVDDGGRILTAGSAHLAADEWILDGDPRPGVKDSELDLAADSVRVGSDAELRAFGAIEGHLRGSRLAAGGALFGAAPSVEFSAERAIVTGQAQTLQGSVQVVWESQSLLAASLVLDAEAGRLRASGGIDLSAVAEPAAETPRFVTITAQDLLVEQETAEIHVAGSAQMRLGDRQIAAERLAVLVDDGAWSQVLADGEVTLEQPDAKATGDRLEYSVGSGDMLLLGSEDRPATFVYDDLEYRSREALRVRWEGEDVIIESTEAGRTTTKVVKREGDTEG